MSDHESRFRQDRTWFFTITLADRESALLTRHVTAIADSARDFEGLYPFDTVATVILPDHMHAIWTLPADDDDYQRRITYLQQSFARRMVEGGHIPAKAENKVWHPRYWDYKIRDVVDMERHIGYIHGNPVRHGLVSHPDKWRYSTWHKYREAGFALWTDKPLGSAGEA